jgi:hypothetical protein
MPRSFSLQQLQDASEHYWGFCTSCGATRECCEPDARHYDCEACGEDEVFGAEELMIMGLVS